MIHEDDDLVVINKPASIPVHPAGRYKHNTIIEIMRHERGGSFKALPVNRLDRLTSGIMFIAKHPKAAEALTTQITARTVRKEYLARVAGRFPDGDVTCEQPILQISPKLGLNRVRANGKTAKTVFRRLAYYPDGSDDQESDKQRKPGKGYSIVLAAPLTGRTHQIRVHLQFLGFPIANDPIYANQRVWRFDLGAGDADGVANTDEDVITRLSRMGKDEVADAVAYHDEMVDDYNSRRAEKMLDLRCSICACPLYSDPGEHELSLWLHSLRYADMHGRWSYTSPYPTWALPPSASDVDELIHGAVKGNIIEAAKDTLPETLE